MRPSRLHAKDGLTLRIPTQKEMRNAKMNERGKDHRGSQEPRKGALAGDSVSGRWRVKVASLPAPLRFAPLRG
jgi:hypothetical protein